MTADDGARGQQKRDAPALQLVVERQTGIGVDALDEPPETAPSQPSPGQEALRDRMAADEHPGEQLPGRGHPDTMAHPALRPLRCPQVPEPPFRHPGSVVVVAADSSMALSPSGRRDY